jgi:hypothetical protein
VISFLLKHFLAKLQSLAHVGALPDPKQMGDDRTEPLLLRLARAAAAATDDQRKRRKFKYLRSFQGHYDHFNLLAEGIDLL